MASTNKKQIGFYADKSVEAYLEKLDSGLKTKKINELIQKEINLERYGPVEYHCHHCNVAAAGKVIFDFFEVYYVDDIDGKQVDELKSVVLVECSSCRNVSLMRAELFNEESEQWYEFELLFPNPYPLTGVGGTLKKNFERAEAAFFRRDFNAVGLYCRRILEDVCRRSKNQPVSLEERIQSYRSSNELTEYEADWAATIAVSTKKVIESSSSELSKAEAEFVLFLTQELLRSKFFVLPKTIIYKQGHENVF